MPQTVEEALRAATLFSDRQLYTIIQLPPTAIMVAAGIAAEIGEAFCALIVDKDEVSLVIPAEAYPDFSQRLRDHKRAEGDMRLITFDVELEAGLVGFMARISQTLADEGISLLPLAAYTRDHILVPANQFDVAIDALEKLKLQIS